MLDQNAAFQFFLLRAYWTYTFHHSSSVFLGKEEELEETMERCIHGAHSPMYAAAPCLISGDDVFRAELNTVITIVYNVNIVKDC